MKSKKGQSEMVGFGIIIIIISILILIFVSFSVNKSSGDDSQSYETESFVQSYLQFTTSCEINTVPKSVLDLMKICNEDKTCDDQENSCEVLNETTKEILKTSWKTGKNYPVKGYEFYVTYANQDLMSFFEGNKTSDSRGSRQIFSDDLQIDFTAYY